MADPTPGDGRPAVYLNGQIVPAVGAGLPVDDHGVLFGAGFFETFRTSGGRPLLWSAAGLRGGADPVASCFSRDR